MQEILDYRECILNILTINPILKNHLSAQQEKTNSYTYGDFVLLWDKGAKFTIENSQLYVSYEIVQAAKEREIYRVKVTFVEKFNCFENREENKYEHIIYSIEEVKERINAFIDDMVEFFGPEFNKQKVMKTFINMLDL